MTRKFRLATVAATHFCVAKPCFACMVCNSNLSYNFVRFTPVWIALLVLWTAITALIWQSLKRRKADSTIKRMYLKPALKYLAVVIVLYVLGLHLVAILFLPLLFLSAAIVKSRQPVAVELQSVQRRLTTLAWVFLAALGISIPISYGLLPRVVSEVETCVRAQKAKKTMHTVRVRQKETKAETTAIDPFAYRSFDVPVLSILVQGFDFYKPLPDPQNRFRYVNDDNNSIVWSRGPDGKFDIPIPTASKAANTTISETSLSNLTYDPTNGIISRGDIVSAGKL